MINRYILHQLYTSLCIITLTGVILIWFIQSLHFIPIIIQHDISYISFFKLTGLLIPSVTGIILPISTFSIILFIYQKLLENNEITILKSLGFSYNRIMYPGLLCAFSVTCLCYILNLWITPLSYRLFSQYDYDIHNKATAIFINEGTFTHLSKDITIFITQKDGAQNFSGIMLEDDRAPLTPITIFANQATLLSKDKTTQLILKEGIRQVINKITKQNSSLEFNHYVIDLSSKIKQKPFPVDIHSLSTYDLLFPSINAPLIIRSKMRVEGFYRIIEPLNVMIYSFIALICTLYNTFKTHRVRKEIIIIYITNGSFMLLSLILKHIAIKKPSCIIALPILPLSSLFILYLFITFYNRLSCRFFYK